MTSTANSLFFTTALQDRQAVATRLLAAALSRKALSNAYLLTGRAVADKWLLALQLAAFLNCQSRTVDDSFSCLSKIITNSKPGTEPGNAALDTTQLSSLCQNCNWIYHKEHPQAWLVLEGQGESGKIAVEKARLLTEELNKTSRYMRVVIIPRAEQEYLHAAPANALLKNIEEPQDNSLFLLFASSAQQVLPTIVSRSQMIPVLSKFEVGLWAPSQGASSEQNDEATAKLAEKLASIKSEFIHSGRKRLSGTSSLHGSYLKNVSESQDLSDRLLALSSGDEGIEADLLIDVLLAAELQILKDASCRQAAISLYMSRLAKLCEESKSQLDHWVRPNNVLESFAYSLTELRSKYLGDFSLAKT